jgi:PAS domain S-box-containing protein
LSNWLFDASGMRAHGSCVPWGPGLVWLHVTSNLCIGLSYLSVPIVLAVIMRRRPDLVFRPVFALGAAFILLCGVGRLMDVATLWVPAYGAAGLVDALTACVALVAAITLWRLMPRMLALPSPSQWRKVNSDLIAMRQAEIRMAVVAGEAASARDALKRELARRMAAEKKMQESEERFHLLLQSNVTDALYLLDAAGNVETWNAAAGRIKGYLAEEIIGKNFAVFFTPEDQAKGVPEGLLARARKSGRYSTDGWRVRKGGARFMARNSIDAIRRPDGTLRGFVKVIQDITCQLVEEEQRGLFLEAAPNGMIIVDENGIITLANKEIERIFGYPRGALVGLSVDVLVPQGECEAHALLRAALAQGLDGHVTAQQQSFVARRRDGSAVTIEMMVNAVATSRGHVLVASLSDVSERVRLATEQQERERRVLLAAETTNRELDRLSRHLAEARDRAQNASQAKSRFLAGITHELRTPLHGLLGYAELLTLEGELSPRQTERLETMMASGQHLLGTVNAVLDMSQIEADRLELQLDTIELQDLIGVCLNVVRPTAEAKGLSLGRAPASTHWVVADPTRLRQVLINLLGNAVKFTPSGSVEVNVRDSSEAGYLRVEVTDTGPGVLPAHRDKLFRIFERLNANSVSDIEGAGLGLAISARLVELMGGRIGYADNAGGGSVFWLEVPAGQAALSAQAGAVRTPVPQAGRKLRILVADDEVLNRSIATGFLLKDGHEVACVDNGIAAVDAATKEDFDLILMDVRMPGMNGMDATRKIRELEGPRGKIRIVAVTAQAFAEQIELCRQAGMDNHLSKPFTKTTLLALLRSEAGDAAIDKSDIVMKNPPAGLPILDRSMFLETTESVPAAELADHLTALMARCTSMQQILRRPGALADARLLGEQAHKLAGIAGMFGLVSVSAVARDFERAAEAFAPDAAALAERFDSALEGSVAALQKELAEAGAHSKFG